MTFCVKRSQPRLGVRVGLVRPHRQTRVEQQHAALGPRRQQPAVARRRLNEG